jgi:sulfur carrier protein
MKRWRRVRLANRPRMSHGAPSIHVYLNGELHQVTLGKPLPEFIESLGLPAQTALVELNGRALLRSEWPATQLAEGDRLEILRVVAGG